MNETGQYLPEKKEDVQLETERLILRRFREEDLEALHDCLSDPEVVKFEPYRPMTLEETAQSLSWRISTEAMIALERKEDGCMIGNLYLGKQEYGTWELGFLLNRACWGQGYAPEACRALLAKAFAEGAHRIVAECDPENSASWHLLERLGFQREAHFRQNVYFWTDAEGKPIWKDTYVYALRSKDALN